MSVSPPYELMLGASFNEYLYHFLLNSTYLVMCGFSGYVLALFSTYGSFVLFQMLLYVI